MGWEVWYPSEVVLGKGTQADLWKRTGKWLWFLLWLGKVRVPCWGIDLQGSTFPLQLKETTRHVFLPSAQIYCKKENERVGSQRISSAKHQKMGSAVVINWKTATWNESTGHISHAHLHCHFKKKKKKHFSLLTFLGLVISDWHVNVSLFLVCFCQLKL